MLACLRSVALLMLITIQYGVYSGEICYELRGGQSYDIFLRAIPEGDTKITAVTQHIKMRHCVHSQQTLSLRIINIIEIT